MKKTIRILVSVLCLVSIGWSGFPAVLPAMSVTVSAVSEENTLYTVRYDENRKARVYDKNGNQVKSGWYEADGNWYYINEYGAGIVKCWRMGIDGQMRYLKADGTMAHDEWIKDYGNWYYLRSDGSKAVDSITLNGVTYYFDLAGVWMDTENISSKGDSVRYDANRKIHVYDANGNELCGGWYEVDSKWYYIDDSGTGLTNIWQDKDGKLHYLKADGTMATNEWVQDNTLWYYVGPDGTMYTGTHTIGGVTYTFDANGVLYDTTSSEGYIVSHDSNFKAHVFDLSGNMVTSGWYEVDGEWYYINDYGAGVVNCWRLKDGKYRYLKADGRMAKNEWIKDYGYWYYLKADGTRYESTWAKIGGKWYWFGGSGKMMAGGWLMLADGNTYYFYSDGHMAANTMINGHWVNGSGVRIS